MPEAFRDTVSALVEMGAEKVLVLQGPSPLKVRASHGFDTNLPWADQVTLHILEQSLQTGEAVLLGDAQEGPTAAHTSVFLLGVRSVLCVPFWSPSSRVGGILYADTRSNPGVFGRKALDTGQLCARKLEHEIYGSTRPIAPPQSLRAAAPGATHLASLGLRPAQPQRNSSAPTVARSPQPDRQGKPRFVSVAGFFKNLAEMVDAGLPIGRCLEILTQYDEDHRLQKDVETIANKLAAGSSLSGAMALFPDTFTAFELHLIKIGERTGSLHKILKDLSLNRDQIYRSQLKLRSALLYPAVVLAFCLALLFLGPPFLLQGQFQLLRQWGQQLPLLTRMLMAASDLLSSPWAFPACLTVAGLVALQVRAAARQPAWRSAFVKKAMKVRGLGGVLRSLATARYARALGMMYRAGLTLPEALQLAAACSGNPILEESAGSVVACLKGGSGLAVALKSTGFFSPLIIHILAAAEEVGRVDFSLEWIAQSQAQELELTLESLMGMLEPILIMTIGILVGLVVLATALPMVQVLQTL